MFNRNTLKISAGFLLIALVLTVPAVQAQGSLPQAQGSLPLAYDSTVTGSLSDTATSLTYTFDGSTDDVISIEVMSIAHDMAPALLLIGPNDEQLTASRPDPLHPASSRASLAFRLPADGAYSLVVTSRNGFFGDFVLSLNVQESAAMSLPTNQPVDLNIMPNSDPLTLRFALAPDTPTTLNIGTESEGFAFAAELRDDSGVLIARFDRAVTAAQLVLPAAQGNAYELMLTAVSADMSGIITVSALRGAEALPEESAAEVAPAPAAAPVATTAPSTDTTGCTNEGLFLFDITVADGSPIEPGQTFVKTWQLRNSGTCAWNEDYTLVKVEGDLFTAEQDVIPMPAVAAGETVNVSVTLTLSAEAPLGESASARFELRSPAGYAFGPQPTVAVTAALPGDSTTAQTGDSTTTQPEDCTNQSTFVEDVTIPDGTPIAPGETFVKTWRMLNSGTCTWNETYRMIQLSGDGLLIAPESAIAIPVTAPGQTADLSVTVTLASDVPGGESRRSNFRLQAPDGQYFGEEAYVEVTAG